MGTGVSNLEILQTPQMLRAGLSEPVWLFDGIAGAMRHVSTTGFNLGNKGD